MKRIFLILLLICNLSANDINETKSALEMFMFKIGITSLTYDLENEKKNIYNNSSEIEQLKKDIKYLLEQNIKNKLVIKDDEPLMISSGPDKDIEKLKAENKKLKLYIKKIENKNRTKIKKRAKGISAIVDVPKVSIKKRPFQNGAIVRYLYQNDIVDIESCDRYGWCKLQDKEEYIPKFKLSIEGNL